MKRLIGALACAALLLPVGATQAIADQTDGSRSLDAETARLVAKANNLTVVGDRKGWRPGGSKVTGAVPNAYGTYSTRKGVILVTPDKFKGLIPTGHSAIIYSRASVVESLGSGVQTGANNWNSSKSQAYQTSVRSTSSSQDSRAADWAYRQRGKPYNYNYLNRDTRSKFYCSQLVWASFKDNFNIDLDTLAYGWAIHPMELVNTSKVYLIWRKN